MLSGDNGLLQKATDAKTRTERARVIEQAKTDILGQIVKNKGENISKDQLKSILNTYFDENEVEALELSDNTSTSTDILTSKEGNYKIKLSEIYSGNLINKVDMSHGLWVNSKKIGDSDNFMDYLQFERTSANTADVRLFLDDDETSQIMGTASVENDKVITGETLYFDENYDVHTECYAILKGQEIELINYFIEYIKALSVEEFMQNLV